MTRLKNAFIVLVLAFAGFSTWAESPLRTEANVPVEISFRAQKKHADPFGGVTLDVIFTDTNGVSRKVPAFWDGGDVWKVRYASGVTGIHHWRTGCNDAADAGLHDVKGELHVTAYRGKNPNFAHGPIHAQERHFIHADGTPFFWLGDTWWMGLCHRLHWPDEFQKLATDRKEKGFTVIQLVAGLYPDMFPFDPRGANEQGFPWQTNYTSIRPEYFDAADVRLRYLVDEGFTPCIVGTWGYFLPWMGVEKMKQHWRYLIARYGAWPVVWCIAGEDNLPWYLAKNFPYDDREQVRGWTEVTRYVRETDPFHRLITIHPTGLGKLNARGAIDNPALLDFDMLQTPHGEADAVAPTIAAAKHAYELPPPMPMLSGESSYEMLMDKIPARWSRAMFWICMMNGAAGHTYGANGIWQCNRRDQPHGASPHGGSYGRIAWDDAMRLPGSQQLGAAKKFLDKFPWQKCSPQANAVAWDKTQSVSWGNWIWYPEGEPAQDAPLEARYFRWKFDLPASGKMRCATLHVGVDNHAIVWIDGKRVGECSGWQPAARFDLTPWMRARNNIIAIRADNEPAPVKLNPAGLIATLELENSGGQTVFLPSNAEWRVAREGTKDWRAADYDDSAWPKAKIVAAYGGGPWGKFDEGRGMFQPFALGIGNQLRMIYALDAFPIVLKNLAANSKYSCTPFNPVTGKAGKAFFAKSDGNGEWKYAPTDATPDYVIVLQRK